MPTFTGSIRSKTEGAGESSLWVLTSYFNPMGYANRRDNYIVFAEELQRKGVPLMLVRTEGLPESDKIDALATEVVEVPYDKTKNLMWMKERLLNIGFQALPPQCKYVVWADCDIIMSDPDWPRKIVTALTRPNAPKILQPFSHAYLMGEDEKMETFQRSEQYLHSFGFLYHFHRRTTVGTPFYITYYPGLVWAASRETLAAIDPDRPFFDLGILGHGDIVMAMAFSHSPSRDGPIPKTWPERHWKPGWNPALGRAVREYQAKAAAVVDGKLDLLLGRVYHLFHGSGKNRLYMERGILLKDFDPAKDLVANDVDQLMEWTPTAIRKKKLPEQVQNYFKFRKEDGKRAAAQ